MADHVNAALGRLVSMQKECIAGSDAVPRFFHWQETFPYWTNRIPDWEYEDIDEDFVRKTYTAYMRLYGGSVTEGFDGELEQRLYAYIPLIEDYFMLRDWSHNRQFLASTAIPEPLDNMDPRGIALLSGVIGTVTQGGAGGGSTAATLMYMEFPLEIPFIFPREA